MTEAAEWPYDADDSRRRALFCAREGKVVKILTAAQMPAWLTDIDCADAIGTVEVFVLLPGAALSEWKPVKLRLVDDPADPDTVWIIPMRLLDSGSATDIEDVVSAVGRHRVEVAVPRKASHPDAFGGARG